MSKFVLLVVISVAAATALQTPPRNRSSNGGKIVGGHNTSVEKFPYQVSLQSEGRHFCGGSIYRSNIIVTAAHCFYGYIWDDLVVVSGVSYLSKGGSNSFVKKFVLHPDYVHMSKDYDVALILLEKEITFGPTMQPIALVEANKKIIVGSRAYVSGWGDLEFWGAAPDQLQYVDVMIMDREKCGDAFKLISKNVTERMLCAGQDHGGKDACYGDSGGPLVLQNRLIGIVSWGENCATARFPGVYTDVAVLRTWIDDTTRDLLSEINIES